MRRRDATTASSSGDEEEAQRSMGRSDRGVLTTYRVRKHETPAAWFSRQSWLAGNQLDEKTGTHCGLSVKSVTPINYALDTVDRRWNPLKRTTRRFERPMQFSLTLSTAGRRGDASRVVEFHQSADPSIGDNEALRDYVSGTLKPHVVVRLTSFVEIKQKVVERNMPAPYSISYGGRLEKLFYVPDFSAESINKYISGNRKDTRRVKRTVWALTDMFGTILQHASAGAPRKGPLRVLVHCAQGVERSRFAFLLFHAMAFLNTRLAKLSCARDGGGVVMPRSKPELADALKAWAMSERDEADGKSIRRWLNLDREGIYPALLFGLSLLFGGAMTEGEATEAMGSADIPLDDARARKRGGRNAFETAMVLGEQWRDNGQGGPSFL